MKKLLLLPIAFLAMISCETGEVNENATAHIYAVGNWSMNDGSSEAYLTRDGISSSLGVGYFVMDLFVNGDDVYTSGSKDGSAVYTKNGVFTVLSTAASASNIYINGDDVYVCGTKDDHPVYWKNGTLNILDVDSGFKGSAYDITVSNNEVYVAGYQHNWSPTNPITNILYWKNETRHTVYSAHTFSFTWLGEISIAVGGDDVYMAVNERDMSSPVFNSNAYLITNGLQETLIDDNSEVHDISVSGSDIYLCGDHISSSGAPNKSVVWKNGTVVVEKDVEHGAFASVFVVSNNIFAVGVESIMVSPDPAPLGTRENHGTTLINNVFELAPDFGTSGNSFGYMAVFVTE
jgi:hypothetical protein